MAGAGEGAAAALSAFGATNSRTFVIALRSSFTAFSASSSSAVLPGCLPGICAS